MAAEYTKDPDDVLDYSFDWAKWLAEGDSVSSSEWIADDGITVDRTEFSSSLTTVWLSGGIAGLHYGVTNRVTTDQGRTVDRTLIIHVTEK